MANKANEWEAIKKFRLIVSIHIQLSKAQLLFFLFFFALFEYKKVDYDFV